MKVTLTTEGFKELQRELKKMTEVQVEQFKKEVYASGLDVQRKAKENLKGMGAWELGNLANTILVDRVDGGKNAEIGPTAPYGPYVEYGTKPHFPPPDALEGWARRHGMDSAWPICVAISKHGTPAQPYLQPAFEDVVEDFFRRVKEIASK